MEPQRRTSCAALLLVTFLISSGEGFSPVVLGKHQGAVIPLETREGSLSAPPLRGIIEPNEQEVETDDGRGGVRLAQESVIQIKGKVVDECEFSELVRFTKVTPLDESTVAACIIYSGSGLEYYQAPETIQGTEVENRFAPLEAVKAALNAGQINPTANKDHISINFAGGDDAQVNEVLDAVEELTRILREEKVVSPSAKIDFRSISHETFPVGSSCVTVVSLASSGKEGEAAADSVASGEVYRSQADGAYYTLREEDINTAVE